jgi:hypothetical protein
MEMTMTIAKYRTWYAIVHCDVCHLSDEEIEEKLK